MSTRQRSRLARRFAAAALVTGALTVGPLALPAHAEDTAESFVVAGSVNAQGVLDLNTTVSFGSAKAPATLTQRLNTRGDAGDTAAYKYDITDIKASSGSTDLGAKVSDDGDFKVITIDTAKAGGKPISIKYRVVGAVHSDPEVSGRPAQNTFNWRVLQGLSVGVKEASGTIGAPAPIKEVDCKAGAPVDPHPCAMYQGGTGEQPNPVFQEGQLGQGQVVILSFTTDAKAMAANEVVDKHWSLDHAFSFNKLSLLLTLGTLLLGALALWALHRRAGRDHAAQAAPTRVGEFSPVGDGEEEFVLVEDLRPGQIGTVADERVDPVDITATLLDLAVRGHLRIHELESEGPHRPLDWTFERRTGGEGELSAYEAILLDAVAPSDGRQVKVSKISSAVGDVVGQVQDELYDNVVEHGWFTKRPDHARNSWTIAAWVALSLALVGTGLLVAFTSLGIFGLALIAVALGFVVVAQEMPRRSSKGSELVAGLHVLATDLQHHRTDQMPKGREYTELSRILPYAVVLGGKDRWIAAIVEVDDDPGEADSTDLDWYWAPATWQMQDLPYSLDAFVTSVQGHLFGR